MKYRKYKINKDGFGLNKRQIALLDQIIEMSEDAIGIDTADAIERVFTRFNFEIGHIGAEHKIVTFAPVDMRLSPSDNGKYHLREGGETLKEALAKVVKGIPPLFSFCADPKLQFSVNR